MSDIAKCAMIGYGSWATALVHQLTEGGTRVKWLVTNPEVTEGILSESRNPKYLRDITLDVSNIEISSSIDEVVDGCEVVFLCCPSAYLQGMLAPLSVSLDGKLIVSAIKGIVPDACTTVLEYMHEQYNVPWSHLGLISGPTHAEEVSCGRTSYICAAAPCPEMAARIRDLIGSASLRVETSTDVRGVEYAGVLKNIYAIVSGMVSGLGYGDNFRAVLVSAAAQEMRRFLECFCPCERDCYGMAYLGDLLVTCYSEFSRNRRLGQLIGRGCSVKSALNEMTMIAEGYFSSKLVRELTANSAIDMPIADLAWQVLYNGLSPRVGIKRLRELL